jgi:hypothetical protein
MEETYNKDASLSIHQKKNLFTSVRGLQSLPYRKISANSISASILVWA